MALTLIDADNLTLVTGVGSTGVTGFPSNGPSTTSMKPFVGTFYSGQYLRDTTTQETGNACFKFRAHNNASAVNDMAMTVRFYPRQADGTDRRVSNWHGLWRVRGEEVADFSNGTPGSTGTGYMTSPGTILDARESTVANDICGIYYRQQGEMVGLYLWHDAVADPVDPALWLGDLPYGANDWVWVEWVVDLDHSSGTEARQAARLVFPDGNPGRWVHDVWTRTYATSTNATFWTFGHQFKDTTAAATVRNWEYISLDRWIIADADDWWTKYDTDGFGNDGLSPDLKVGFVVCDNSPTMSSAWTAGAGGSSIQEVPSDGTVTVYRYANAEEQNLRCGFSTSGTAYDTADLTDVGTVLGVVVKGTMACNLNNTVMDAEIGIRSSGGTVASHTIDVFSQNWAECNSYGYPSTVQPGGSTRWEDSADPISDLAGMTAYVARGTPGAGTTSGDLRLFDLGAYVVYRPEQVAPASDTVGELTDTPTVTAPTADCDYVPVEWRAVVEGQPVNVGGTDYTTIPLMGMRSTYDNKVYAAHWGVYPYETNPANGASVADGLPMVVAYDLEAGTSEVVWRSNATVAKSGSYTSTPPTGGPPSDNGSGSWCWERWNGGTSAHYNMRPHRAGVDNWPTLSDGTTPNPWYGWIYVVFGHGDSAASAADRAPCHGVMFIHPTDPYDGGDGVLRKAKMVPYPTNIGSTSSAKGSFGVSSNPDEILVARPGGQTTTSDSAHLLSKTAIDITSGLPDTTDTTGWWTNHGFGTYTASEGQEIVNQTSYGDGKLWTTGTGFMQCIKTTTTSFDSKRITRFTRGNNTLRCTQVRVWSAAPDGLMYGVQEAVFDSGSIAAYVNTRIAYGGDLQNNRSSHLLLQMTPGDSSTNPSITKHWRIPWDQFADAPTDGEWRNKRIVLSALSITAEDHFLIGHESHDPVGVDYFPRHTMAWFNSRRNEWREIRAPHVNAHPAYAVWHLLPDAEAVTAGTKPDNRRDMFDGDQSPTDELYRFSVFDMGWPDGDYDYPPSYDGTDGNTASANLGSVWEGDFGSGPWRRESDIGVDFTVDLPAGETDLEAWRVEVDGDGTLGSGLLVDGSNTTVTTSSGGSVTVNACIPAHQVPDHASDTITIDVFWKVAGVWSARES